jgi:acetoin utilization deacetylase AcuC-like enzyme
MSVALFTHDACLSHVPPAGHPESPERLRAVLAALSGPEFAPLIRFDAPRASDESLALVHPLDHVRAVEARGPVPGARPVSIDPDTWLSAGSVEAARRAAGAAVAAVDWVMGQGRGSAFCAVRPPGHHAEPGTAMGFCLWNNAAIAARHARQAHGLKRVAVVDFDVHHGNGSQALAEVDPDFFYASIHQGGAYPGTGFANETGAAGNLINAPVREGTDGPAWRDVFSRHVLAALDAFAPQMIIISAGFDAHRLDPLAGLALEASDFAWATRELHVRAHGKLVSVLEGGYHIAALGQCVHEHVLALLDGEEGAGGASLPAREVS